MKARSFIPAIALLISTTAVFANSPVTTKSWSAYGPDIVVTSASNAEIISAIHATHDKLSKHPTQDAGRIVDRSFKQDFSQGRNDENRILRSKTSFDDQNGANVSIEYVFRSDGDTMVFFEGSDEADVKAVTTEFVNALESQGVKRAK